MGDASCMRINGSSSATISGALTLRASSRAVRPQMSVALTLVGLASTRSLQMGKLPCEAAMCSGVRPSLRGEEGGAGTGGKVGGQQSTERGGMRRKRGGAEWSR